VRVLLISANTEAINLLPLPLGLACVAAATARAGHEVVLLNLMFEQDTESALRQAIQDFHPGIIGVSVRNIDDQNMGCPQFLLAPVRQVVATCRSLCPAPIVLGGAGYSIFPESALRYLGADVGIQGEGETVFPHLVDRIARGAALTGLPGIYLPSRPPHSRSFAKNLDDLPLPNPALWIPPMAGHPDLWVPVQSRRGCPWDCSFCSTRLIEGRSIRRRSPGALLKWLADLRAAGCRNFTFVDNTFNLPLAYAKELCRKIIEARLGMNLWCMVYPKWIDSELVELMRRAGCSQISLGFESGSDSVLRNLRKRFNSEEVKLVAKMFADAGIERFGFLLLGGPGETRDSVEESLALAHSLNLEGLKITVGLRIYPQTPLAAAALAEGVITPGDDLLRPRFYLASGLRAWLPQGVAAYKASRPWVN
jgi:radical SAM superfamily enzyme YgiQ (UPF0313 family)